MRSEKPPRAERTLGTGSPAISTTTGRMLLSYQGTRSPSSPGRASGVTVLQVTTPIITEVYAEPWDIPLTEPFGIATGAQYVAANVLVRVQFSDGTVGLGEAAPFPAVNGETQADALLGVSRARDAISGQDPTRWRRMAALLEEALPDVPSLRAALECAVLDGVTRRSRLSLHRFFGGVDDSLETDITIVTGTEAHARAAAERAASSGFRTLKVKVGGVPHEEDVLRLHAILAGAPGARLILDANASFTSEEAIALVERIGAEHVALFEQPTAADDLDGMRAVRKRTRVLVAADESARSASDVARLAQQRAADVINVKITKCGVAEACDMIAAARGYDLALMIGGMVESKLAMSFSACLAAGIGGFEFVDLDTPLFMKDARTHGGFEQDGPILRVSHIDAGHGVTVGEQR
jgi:L-alanine-DL-glutamate epimerase-like enolase superfamily enzyme